MSETEPSQRQQSIQIVTNDTIRGRRTKTMSGDQPPGPKKLSLKRAATTLFKPEKKLKDDPSVLQSLKAILFASCMVSLRPYFPSVLLTGSYRAECPPAMYSYLCMSSNSRRALSSHASTVGFPFRLRRQADYHLRLCVCCDHD
jgi:hypothetical protein